LVAAFGFELGALVFFFHLLLLFYNAAPSLGYNSDHVFYTPTAIRGPKILRDSWDKKKTVRQKWVSFFTLTIAITELMWGCSYAALGLVHSLNPLSSGGVELDPTRTEMEVDTEKEKEAGKEKERSIPKGHAKIIRDEEGNVVSVEYAAEDQNEEVEEEGMGEVVVGEDVMRSWVSGLGGGKGKGKNVVEGEFLDLRFGDMRRACISLLFLLYFDVSCHRTASQGHQCFMDVFIAVDDF
jgi:hypothetical protein